MNNLEKKENPKPNEEINPKELFGMLLDTVVKISTETTRQYYDYKKVEQQERTQRTLIKSQLKLAVEMIHAQKEMYLKALDQDHNRKMELIKGVNTAFLVAAENGDHETVKLLSQSISDLKLVNLPDSIDFSFGSNKKLIE